MDQLIKNAKISPAVTPAEGVAGTSDINGSTLFHLPEPLAFEREQRRCQPLIGRLS